MMSVETCPDCPHSLLNHGPTSLGEPSGCSLCSCTTSRPGVVSVFRTLVVAVHEWAKKVFETSVKNGWWGDGSYAAVKEIADDPNATMARLMLVTREVSEAAELVRKPDFDAKHFYYDVNGKPEGYGVELADVVLRVMDECWAQGIDLGEMMRIKHEYNEKRGFRHGGKRV